MSCKASTALILIILLASACAPQSVVTPRPSAAPPTAAGNPTAKARPIAAPAALPLPIAAPATALVITPAREVEASPAPPLKTGLAPSHTPTASATTAPPAGTATPAAPVRTVTTYTSAALGISFSYLPEQDGRTIGVAEHADRIYVYYDHVPPAAGQSVQVFQKMAGESLVDAIKRVIMSGYPAQDCQVVQIARPAGAGEAPNFQYAGIVVRPVPGESQEDMLPRWRTCPHPYTVVGGIGYFQADTQHPTRFLFLNIGQYYILAGDDLPWQATIRFQ